MGKRGGCKGQGCFCKGQGCGCKGKGCGYKGMDRVVRELMWL